MSQHPFFSVVMPTHNRSDLLEQAIGSVLEQTFTDFELIVIDDHSTDSTQERLTRYQDPRLSYFLNDHGRGGAGARNAGIFRAKGQWVAFLDDDDVWLPEKLARQYAKIIDISSEVGFIYTGYATYDFQRERVLAEFYPQKEGWILSDLLYQNYVTGFCGIAVRTDLLQAVGGLDAEFPALQDIDLYVRLAQHTPFVYLAEILFYVRKGHAGRISMNWDNKLVGYQRFRQKYDHLLATEPSARYQIDSRIAIYGLLAKKWTVLGELDRATRLRLLTDLTNYQWLCKEWGASYLNKWRGQAGIRQ